MNPRKPFKSVITYHVYLLLQSEDGDLSQTNHLLQEQHDQVRLDLQIAEEVITKLKAEINELHTVKEQVCDRESV